MRSGLLWLGRPADKQLAQEQLGMFADKLYEAADAQLCQGKDVLEQLESKMSESITNVKKMAALTTWPLNTAWYASWTIENEVASVAPWFIESQHLITALLELKTLAAQHTT
eukprot:9201453-Prorocentrum_lima.AAC.1